MQMNPATEPSAQVHADPCDELHRAWAGQSVHGDDVRTCWLVIDRAALGLAEAEDPWLAEVLARGDLHAVMPPAGVEIPPAMTPALLALRPQRAADSQIISQSIALAMAELQSARLASGAGRCVSGWLDCEAGTSHSALLQHLGRSMVVRDAGGAPHWLRWQDPAVLWALWPDLTAEQQATLFGPVCCFWLLDPAGTLCALQPARTDRAGLPAAVLALQPRQWQVLHAISAMNLAFVQGRASGMRQAQLRHVRDIALAAVARMQALGFSDVQDLSQAALRAIDCHPRFDTHAIVAACLRARQPDQYFAGLRGRNRRRTVGAGGS